MDCVDPWQPTQSYNVGVAIMQGNNVHSIGVHSGRLQPIRVDLDEYVELGQDNVDVGLNLQGQFY